MLCRQNGLKILIGLGCCMFILTPTESAESTTLGITTPKPHEELQFELETHRIIPDCIDETPPYPAQIKFLEKTAADFGNILPVTEIKFAPYLMLYPVKLSSFYTIMMVGLDEPSQNVTTKREWLYYLIVNVPGTTAFGGEVIAKWIQPLPQIGTGTHRYVFIVYEQKCRTTVTETRMGRARSDKERARFSHKRFAEKYKFGKPLAVNFFYCLSPFNSTVTAYPDELVPEPTDNYYKMAREMEEEEERKKKKEEQAKGDKGGKERKQHKSKRSTPEE